MGVRSKGFNDETIGYFVGFIVAVFVFFLIYDFIYNKKRKESVSKYCSQNGLKYTRYSESILDCNEKFDMILRGKDQRLDHIMSGSRGDYEFQIFDFYYYLKKRGPRLNTYDKEFGETICFLRKKGGKAFPHFYMFQNVMLDDNIDDLLPKVEGIKDIEFPLEEDTKLIVKSVNEDEMRTFFTKQRVDSVSKFFDETGGFIYVYEGKGDCLLVAYPQIKQVAERLELLECAVKLYEAL